MTKHSLSSNHMNIHRRLNIVNSCLTMFVIFFYVYSGNLFHLISWGVIGAILFSLFKIFIRKEYLGQHIFIVVVFSYLLLSLVGTISFWFYEISYGSPFAPYNDDSYYFDNIISIAGGNIPYDSTLFEFFLAPVYWLFTVIEPTIKIQDLLPVNWALGALIVGLSTILATRIGGRFSLLAPAALLFNFNFVDTTIHLYRDGLLLTLTLFCILSAMQKRYAIAMVFALLVGLARGGNGLLCFLYILILFLCHTGLLYKLNLRSLVVFFAMLFIFFAVDKVANLGNLGRTFLGYSSVETQSLAGRAKTRTEWMLEADSKGFDSIKFISAMGPLGKIAIPFANVFNPVRWSGFGSYTDVVVRGYNVGSKYIVRPVLAIGLITVLLWPMIGPYLIQGLRVGINGRSNTFALFIIFIFTLLAISYVSFQSRHRTAFEIFFPCLVTLATFETQSDRKLRFLFTLFFIALIIAANIIPKII